MMQKEKIYEDNGDNEKKSNKVIIIRTVFTFERLNSVSKQLIRG